MKQLLLGLAAVALLLAATENASAQYFHHGAYFNGYNPSAGLGVSNGTRIRNNGIVVLGYSSYPTYSFVAPAYYATPIYYAQPMYNSPPIYYRSGPFISNTYYRGGRWGRWGW